MQFQFIDWAIIIGSIVLIMFVVSFTRRFTRSAADYLAANRLAGRYLLTLSEGSALLAAIAIIANFQRDYQTGFAQYWWYNLCNPLWMLIALTGWVVYRFRETRAMTLAQFLEMRYNKPFRVFAGLLCWISGIINFGIFPAVGVNFFMSYCNLPETYHIIGIPFAIPMFHTLLFILIGISLYFTFIGGQIAVLVADFLQSFLSNMVMIAILIILLVKFPLGQIFEGLTYAPEGKSMLNPFDTGQSDFTTWYFVIIAVSYMYNRISWQGHQAYYVSAKSPHEAKMAQVLAMYRGYIWYGLVLLPLVAYMFMNHPDYTEQAAQVDLMLSKIGNDQVREQMITPMTMTLYLPVGMIGAFGALMLAAFVSNHDTYLHSWGSIFVQDVFLPLYKKPLSPKGHIFVLRMSAVFVAVFIFFWSCWFKQTQDIWHYFNLTGAIWLGGAGMVIIGGLYTRWGTTAAAFSSLICGSAFAFSGLICEKYWPAWFDGDKFFLTGTYVYFWAMVAAALVYVVVSFSGKRRHFDLDKMLHRGKYTVESDHEKAKEAAPVTSILKVEETGSVSTKVKLATLLGFTKDFTFWDKIIYGFSYLYAGIMFLLFVVGTAAYFIWGFGDNGWTRIHLGVLIFNVIMAFLIAIWLSIGGIKDAVSLFKGLVIAKRDASDDGSVREDFSEKSEQQ